MVNSQERSIGELFSELSNQVSSLVQSEIALAKLELKQKVTHLSKNTVYVIAGALIGYVALMALAATLILALANLMPAWGAALLVTIIFGAIAAFLAAKGAKALKQSDLAPRQTVQTLKEDMVWARQQIR